MSDYGRYDDTRTRDRHYGDERQGRDSMFSHEGRDDRSGRDGRGYRSDRYGRDDEDRNRWRGEDRYRDQHRDRDRDRPRSEDRDERHYGRDDDRDGLPIDETGRLIASNKVEGTAVYGSDGSRLGSIYNFMVDKVSGRAEYAVMSYGGVLGMGSRYYPLPWRVLTYDTEQRGYRVQMTSRDLRDAPSFDRESEPRFDRRYGEHVHRWYGIHY